LMQERSLTYDEALAAVRKQRSVQPNMGFEAQLRAWEKHLTAAALPRLDAKSTAAPPPSHDLPVNVAEREPAL